MKFLLCVCSILCASGLKGIKKRDFVTCTVNSPGMRCMSTGQVMCGQYSWREIAKDQSDEGGSRKRFTTCAQFGEDMDCGDKMMKQNAVTLTNGVNYKEDCCMPTCDNTARHENEGCCLGHGVGGPVKATIKKGDEIVALVGTNGILFTDKDKQPVPVHMMLTAHDKTDHGTGTDRSRSFVWRDGIVSAKKSPCVGNRTEVYASQMKVQVGVFKTESTEGVIYNDGIKFTAPNTKIDNEKAYVFANAHSCGGPKVDLMDETGKPLTPMRLNAQITTGPFEGPTGGRSSIDAMTAIISKTGTRYQHVPDTTPEKYQRHSMHGAEQTETS